MPLAGRSSSRAGWKSHSFYVKVVTAFVGLLLITVLPILVYNFNQGRQIVLGLSGQLLDQTARTVIEKTNNYFLPASVAVEIAARLSEIGAISPTNIEQVELYTLGVLKSYKQVSMFYLADEQGNYIRAWRLPEGTMESRALLPSASPPRDTLRYWDKDFKVFNTQESLFVNAYDPRVRPWYVAAKANRTNSWTDIYILFRNKVPAITTSFPIVDKNGKVTGVWAMDIELREISEFLRSLKVGKTGVAFILNQNDEVVAYPDASKLIREEDGKLRPVRVHELGVPPITAAHEHYLHNAGGKFAVKSGGSAYYACFEDFPANFPVPWKIAMVVPQEDFTRSISNLIKEMGLICLIILGCSIILAIRVSRSISRPIRQLAEETKKIRAFDLNNIVTVSSYVKEVQLMSDAIAAMRSGLVAFRKYVPHELVRRLIHTGEEARLGGHKEVLTVLFSDIAGFTGIAERTPPEELTVQLSEYFDELTKIISNNKGTVDKYIGDAILAFWGAPIPDDDHIFNACRAAVACQEKIEELNRRWEAEGKNPFHTRIGISTGVTVVGNVGSTERINYTVMGDNVNLASRLEGANKLFRTKILVPQYIYSAVADRLCFRLLGTVAVKGKTEKTTVYELVAERNRTQHPETAKRCEEFTRGVEAYLARNWSLSSEIFHNLTVDFPGDGPALFYLSRSRLYCDHPPGPNWRGVEYLETK
ncbi:MAG: hypothetical protein LLG06_12395 [Desulfobacteraceae bacterium]|nr:hypothetical protein [Desulfobacteraceae bacterium]